MLKKKNTNDPINYCGSCFCELSNDNFCSECAIISPALRKSIESIYPDYKKMFLPQDEGITWERVR
jgi:hypothetical protein